MKTLHLVLKGKWYDMIEAGLKLEEYREIKEYWVHRLVQMDRQFKLEDFTIKYDDVASAFSFCWGYKTRRPDALKFLLTQGCSTIIFDHVVFSHGYSKNRRQMTWEFKAIEIGRAKPEWSDNWQGEVFIIKLGERIDHVHVPLKNHIGHATFDNPPSKETMDAVNEMADLAFKKQA